MRVIVYGVGAIGGAIAARIALSGGEVVGIARGAMLDAITAQGGLKLTSPGGASHAEFACVSDPADIEWRPDDAVILAMKSQDTAGALARLLAAGVREQPIFCAQNGVANEREALRYFPNVYGVAVMVPAQYVTPGAVEAFGQPKFGLFDIGRYPSGLDGVARGMAELLDRAEFGCELHESVMESKYAKLLINVGNMVGAALGHKARYGPWTDAARQEAEAVYAASGIARGNVDFDSPRRDLMKPGVIPGIERSGSSSLQSLARHTGSLETDYLNGEIVLMGRLCGVDTPINATLCEVARCVLAEGIEAGDFPESRLAAMVEARRGTST